MLLLTGPSGSGKTSLVQAGLLARLRTQQVPGFEETRVVQVRPGGQPTEALQNALIQSAQPAILPQFQRALRATTQDTLPQLAPSPATPKRVQKPGLVPHVVVMDPFEEIFTLCTDEAVRKASVNLLLRNESDLWSFVLVINNHDLPVFRAQYSHLRHLLDEASVEVEPMTEEQLLSAIRKSASQAGFPLDDRTVKQLVEQTMGKADALPQLGFVLCRLFAQMTLGKKPAQALKELGGVQSAMSVVAQQIYDALTPAEQQIANRAFGRLATPVMGGREEASRVPAKLLCGNSITVDPLLAVLWKFSTEQARFPFYQSLVCRNPFDFEPDSRELTRKDFRQGCPDIRPPGFVLNQDDHSTVPTGERTDPAGSADAHAH